MMIYSFLYMDEYILQVYGDNRLNIEIIKKN